MSNLNITANVPSFLKPIPRPPRGPGVPRPSPITAINTAWAALTVKFREALRQLKDELPYESNVPPLDACRLVSLTPSGDVEMRLISDLASVPHWSLTAIAAHEIQFRPHQVIPRAEDITFLHDLSDRLRITQVPNTVRSWIDGGHYLGLYDGLSAWDCVKLVAHYKKTLGHVPHPESVSPHLKRATQVVIQARRKVARAEG